MAEKIADFSGWATKAGLKCADGRTIMRDAFAEQDGAQVPLVWQHAHNEPGNVLGHAVLENRPEGVYCRAFFNDTPAGQQAKALVQHKDITQLSIYANKLVEKTKQVFHGKIREVSLVLAGANPGALIDNIAIQHADGTVDELEDEAIIFTGLEVSLEHADPASQSDSNQDVPLEEIWNSMTDEQRNLAEYMVGAAVEAATEAAASHADADEDEGDDNPGEDAPGDDPGTETEGAPDPDSVDSDNNSDEANLDNQEGTEMKHNVFDQSGTKKTETHELSHDALKGIFETAKRLGSVKEAVEDYALQHGIEDIEVLFPDAQAVTSTPDFLARRTEWVAEIMNGTRHTPFSRIKSVMADITLDEARAKGYVKGNMKREEFFRVSKRTTDPQTVYKKQKLDRDDILDITDFDVVAWLKGELRLMLEEEVARAVLIGDGRSVGDEDKIMDDKIRPIASEHELYATTVYVNIDDADSDWEEVVDALVLNRRHYRGSGNPTFFTTEDALARMLLIKDSLGRRVYPTVQDLAAAIRCNKIVAVEAMETETDLVGIMVNLQDYTIGADRGGETTMFDDFDIDYNQYKYLLETRISGALTKLKSALVVRRTAAANTLATPTAPSFDANVVTIPTDANATYTRTDTGATLAAGATVTLSPALREVSIEAEPVAGKYFATDDNVWSYSYDEDGV